ncbi:unnamed protein product [Aspergillus oryzae]|uniref:Unnamed protein product n=1 Tax=Aspergillus oryzae TaxID=5062 RepID=A0AAN4YI24_ASPOZ|nr:unnamed protein product [Aspergillus oryzae]
MHPLLLLLYSTLALGQLIGPVGPTTPLSEKTTECNILSYGAVADNSTDISTALETTFNDCVRPNPGSRLVVPEGQYLLNRGVVLSNATNWAFQLDGLVTAAYGGNWEIERSLILQGFAGVDLLNETINGEGDHKFLLDVLVIVNGEFFSSYLVGCINVWLEADLAVAVDFEFYSSNGLGAFQGQGYLYRNLNKYEDLIS